MAHFVPSNPFAVYDVTKTRFLLHSATILFPKRSQRTYVVRAAFCPGERVSY
jgi:hypothetical protein